MKRVAAGLVLVLRLLAVKLAPSALVVGFLASLVFLAIRVLPGDPSALVLGDEATEAERAQVRSELHFDEPLGVQYVRFARGLVTWDLGDSLRRPGTKATARVSEAFVPTAELAGVAVVLGSVFGLGTALLAAGPWLGRRRFWIDRALVALASFPLLAFAPVVTFVLAGKLRLVPLPGDPDSGAFGLLYSSALLALPLGAHVGRIGRAALAGVSRQPFLAAARARGGSPARAWVVHALPAASGPLVTVIATQLGALLGGAVVLERLFERAGLGTLILEAYSSRDVPVLEAAIVASGALFVVAQGVALAAHAAIDPRVRR